MSIKYRKANISDISELVEMRWDFQLIGREKHVNSKKKFDRSCKIFFEESFDSKNRIHFISETKNEIIAHVSLQIVKNIPVPGNYKNYWGYITNVYTKPLFRKKGIATKLMRIAIDYAKKHNIKKIILRPRDESINIYKKFDFSQNSEIMELKIQEK